MFCISFILLVVVVVPYTGVLFTPVYGICVVFLYTVFALYIMFVQYVSYSFYSIHILNLVNLCFTRSCMYCNIVQWLNTVGLSISVYTRVSYVHMILENFCKTSGVVCEIYSLLRVFRIFVFFSASRNDRNLAKQ